MPRRSRAEDKIHPMPFPGLNIDNLPFFAVIAANATGIAARSAPTRWSATARAS